MRFEIMILPDMTPSSLASKRQLSTASCFALQSFIYDLLNLLRSVSRLAARTRGDFPKRLQAMRGKSCPPQGHGLAIDVQWLGDGAVGLPHGGCEHDATP
jgi:hypothetical protein